MKELRREILLAIAYPFFIIGVTIMLFVPRCVRIYLSNSLTKIAWRCNMKAYRIAANNLRLAYPNLSIEEVSLMAKNVMGSFARSAFDFFSSCILINNRRFRSMVEVEGEENLKIAHNKGKGVICMIPHLSAWELSAVTPPIMGYKTYAASKPIKGWLFNKTFVWLRGRRGMINFARGGSYNKLLEVLNNGHCLIIMADQDTKVKGEFLEFFGREAYTPIGISRLALDTEASVVPMAMTRKENGLYKFTIYPALETIRTGDYAADCTNNTIIQVNEYERIIRMTPTQWVWMHKRWKTTRESLAKYLNSRKKK